MTIRNHSTYFFVAMEARKFTEEIFRDIQCSVAINASVAIPDNILMLNAIYIHIQ